MTTLECDIFSGQKNVSVEALPWNSHKSRQLDYARANERIRLFHDSASGNDRLRFKSKKFDLFSESTLKPTDFGYAI